MSIDFFKKSCCTVIGEFVQNPQNLKYPQRRKSMEIFQIYLTVWGIACMTVGILISKYLLWIPGQPAGIIEIDEIKR